MENTGRTCLIELHYWPNAQFMSKFAVYDEVVIEQHEHYQKRSFRNKCQVLGPNGAVTLSVPLLKGKHQQMPVREVEISYARPWYATHWHTIETAYGSAPYFAHYAGNVREVLYQRHQTLFVLNMACLDVVRKILDLPEVAMSEDYTFNPIARDLRNVILLKNPLPDDTFAPEPYVQVFADRFAFVENLSILDVLFCLGPEAVAYLKRCVVDRLRS